MRKLSSKLVGQQSGFTLIELVIVIVIIGILAAVAIPNFTNLSADAKNAKADATLGALASWASTNYARCQGGLAGAVKSATCDTTTLTAAMDGGAVGTAEIVGGKCVVTLTEGGISTATTTIKTTGTTCP